MAGLLGRDEGVQAPPGDELIPGLEEDRHALAHAVHGGEVAAVVALRAQDELSGCFAGHLLAPPPRHVADRVAQLAPGLVRRLRVGLERLRLRLERAYDGEHVRALPRLLVGSRRRRDELARDQAEEERAGKRKRSAGAVSHGAGSYVCYNALGSDLLPAFDEGGFVLDYVMPPGSSLQETNRVLGHVEAILRATPEVESTSRRTGLELGLAAVTEPNTGDIAVKLKDERSRSVDDVISDVRAQGRRRPSRCSTSSSSRCCRT